METIIKVFYSWARRYVTASKTLSHNSRTPLASSPLARNWVCLSSDGSIKIEDDFAAAVGLLRDSNGAWIFGFYRYIGNCFVMDVELWGILDGLQLSLDKDFQCNLIQIDSLETIVAIQEDPIECHKSTLIRRIQQLLTEVSLYHIQHIPKKENKITNAPAKIVCNRRTGIHILEDPQ
ncbi:hypothetical protein Gohar_024353 [Gossypium harknessii]|uniref:RNase H type-1 domain-containing protein n=1 Tax=Gossypium harknessii TaxID=34285 RepID=A0A7J9HFL8_9ROSI|nr:hypothetical protein [Gossypium harknessii]